MRRDLLEKLKSELVESYRRIHSQKMFRIDIEADERKNPEISVMVTTKEQENIVRKNLLIKKVYKRGTDIARENNLDKIDINSSLADKSLSST